MYTVSIFSEELKCTKFTGHLYNLQNFLRVKNLKQRWRLISVMIRMPWLTLQFSIYSIYLKFAAHPISNYWEISRMRHVLQRNS